MTYSETSSQGCLIINRNKYVINDKLKISICTTIVKICGYRPYNAISV